MAHVSEWKATQKSKIRVLPRKTMFFLFCFFPDFRFLFFFFFFFLFFFFDLCCYPLYFFKHKRIKMSWQIHSRRPHEVECWTTMNMHKVNAFFFLSFFFMFLETGERYTHFHQIAFARMKVWGWVIKRWIKAIIWTRVAEMCARL